MHTVTPRELSKQVLRFAAQVAPGQVPVYVPVTPFPDTRPSECFGNVETAVQQVGGQRILGWAIWEWPNVLLEGEFHAVWQSPDGSLRDITPKADGDENILFLSDPRLTYEGAYVDNRRMALRDDAVIVDFIRVSEELFRITRIGKPGQAVYLRQEDVVPLAKRHEYLRAMLAAGLRDHDPCFCGSGSKYKKCHALVPRR